MSSSDRAPDDPGDGRPGPGGEQESAPGTDTPEPAKAKQRRRSREASSPDYLRDSVPTAATTGSFGVPGLPFQRHSPFFIGFTGAAGALLAYWLAQQIQAISSILVLVVVALFLAVGLNPAVEFFMRRGARRTSAVLIVIALVLVALTLFVVAIIPVITDQVESLSNQAPEWWDQVRNSERIRDLDQRYQILDRVQQAIEQGGLTNKVFGGVLGVGLAVLSAIANAFIVVVLTLYFLASLPGIKRFFYRLAPASRRERVTALGDQILTNVGGYVSGAFVVATAAGLSSLVFLVAAGLGEYAVALAFVVAVLDVIPMIGATLGAVVVTAIGFATSPATGIACLVFYIVYQQFENYVIYPRVMARSVDIPGSLIVIAALTGGALLGVIGALLAIPTAAAAQLLLREVFLRRQDTR
jgi:predicted PurR-regulated permease PerM